MFIGRQDELKKLNNFYNSKDFEMVIVYGRRRVGKTKLLTEFISDKKSIFYVAEENNDLLNKERFSKVVHQYFNTGLDISFNYWDDIFKYIAKNMGDERVVLVIDEFPYLALANKSLMSTLQNIIDHQLANKNIMVILCGSSISFMENEIVAHKSPLYGRKTGQLKVLPMNYFEVSKFFIGYSVKDRFATYAILGGIPYYLIRFNEKDNLDNNIIKYLMDTSSFLYDEPKNLLHQELRNPAVYNSIITAIAKGCSKINEIATTIGETQSKTNKYIQSLLGLEIVCKKIPIGTKHIKKSIYSINDNLYRFMYKFVFKHRSLLEQGLGKEHYNRNIKPQLNSYYGKIFEDVCTQYLKMKNKRLELPFMVEEFGGWWGNNPKLKIQEEIDIVGLSTKEGLYCECKYRNEKTGISVLKKLISRSNLINREIKYYYIFSKEGFTSELLNKAKTMSNVQLLTLENLYN